MPRGSWTNRQGFLGFTGFPPDWRERQAAQLAEFPTHPVVNISWYEACAFTLWLEKRWSETEWWPHGWKVSLPSQEEWEKAARGGLKTNLPRILAPNQILGSLGPAAEPIEFLANPAPRRIYPCNALPNPEEINFADTGLRGTSALGCFDSNDALYGIQDLAGNAFEWTVSHWPNTPSMYVVKGGSFHSQASHTRIGFNFRYEAIRAIEFCGFRCLIRRP